jgi:hypothetical protein
MTWSASIQPVVGLSDHSFCLSVSIYGRSTCETYTNAVPTPLADVGPRRPHGIAALGAFLTIMTAFTGFASQQLLVFDECLRRDSSAHVSIAKSTSYNLTGPRIGAGAFQVAEEMTSAIELGIIQPNQDQTTLLSRGCVTGNCTFPATNGTSYSSLAIGHTCKDVTSEVFTVPTNITYTGPDGNDYQRFWANLTAPDGENLSFSSTGLPIGGNSYTLSTRAYPDPDMGSIAVLQMITIREVGQTNYTAYRCSIFPTMNTYGVNISKTRLEETLLDSVPVGVNMISVVNKTVDERQTQFKRASSFVLRNGVREACTRRDTPSPGFEMVAEANIDAAPDPKLGYPTDVEKRVWYYPTDCVWRFGQGAAMGTRFYIQQIYEEQLLTYYQSLQVGTSGSIHLRKLFREGNITLDTVNADMGNLTRSMSAVIRTFGVEGEAAYANGTQWYTTTCLGINWPWLSFDGAMIGLSAIFLVLVAIESRGIESERLWKSSVLATLFCEIDGPVTAMMKPVGKESMGTIAKSTSVSLDPSRQTLRLLST